MAKIQRGDIPRLLLEHLLLRVRDRDIDAAAIQSLAAWLDTNPEVPTGSWFKRFPAMIVCGDGALLKPSSLPPKLPSVMSYEGSRANRQQTIVTYLCPDRNSF